MWNGIFKISGAQYYQHLRPLWILKYKYTHQYHINKDLELLSNSKHFLKITCFFGGTWNEHEHPPGLKAFPAKSITVIYTKIRIHLPQNFAFGFTTWTSYHIKHLNLFQIFQTNCSNLLHVSNTLIFFKSFYELSFLKHSLYSNLLLISNILIFFKSSYELSFDYSVYLRKWQSFALFNKIKFENFFT